MRGGSTRPRRCGAGEEEEEEEGGATGGRGGAGRGGRWPRGPAPTPGGAAAPRPREVAGRPPGCPAAGGGGRRVLPRARRGSSAPGRAQKRRRKWEEAAAGALRPRPSPGTGPSHPRAPAPRRHHHRSRPRPRAGIVLEIAASLEVKPYLRVNPRRTLSPAHARAGLHRGCIYLPAGGGRTGTGTLARRLAPRCCGDTRVGTASQRGPAAVGEGGDTGTPRPLSPQRCSSWPPPPKPGPSPLPRHSLPGAGGRAKCPFTPRGIRHRPRLAWKSKRLRASSGAGEAGAGLQGGGGSRAARSPLPRVQHLPAEQQERGTAPGRGCGAASRPGSSPRLGALGMLGGFPEELLEKGEGEKGMSFPSSSICRFAV